MPRKGGKHFVVLAGAEQAMDAFKMEIADDLGLGAKLRENGWKGMSTQEAGAVGGEMVKRVMVAGEQAVLDRFNAGQKLSPVISAGTMINNADPVLKKPETENEQNIMAAKVVQ